MLSHTRMMQINPPDDWLKTGWTRDSQARTRLVDSLFYITCSLENNAFFVLFSLLPYISTCYLNLRFFLPLEQSRTALLGCRLAASRRQEAARWP